MSKVNVKKFIEDKEIEPLEELKGHPKPLTKITYTINTVMGTDTVRETYEGTVDDIVSLIKQLDR